MSTHEHTKDSKRRRIGKEKAADTAVVLPDADEDPITPPSFKELAKALSCMENSQTSREKSILALKNIDEWAKKCIHLTSFCQDFLDLGGVARILTFLKTNSTDPECIVLCAEVICFCTAAGPLFLAFSKSNAHFTLTKLFFKCDGIEIFQSCIDALVLRGPCNELPQLISVLGCVYDTATDLNEGDRIQFQEFYPTIALSINKLFEVAFKVSMDWKDKHASRTVQQILVAFEMLLSCRTSVFKAEYVKEKKMVSKCLDSLKSNETRTWSQVRDKDVILAAMSLWNTLASKNYLEPDNFDGFVPMCIMAIQQYNDVTMHREVVNLLGKVCVKFDRPTLEKSGGIVLAGWLVRSGIGGTNDQARAILERIYI